MKPILEIQNVAKRFLIGHEHLPYYSFRDKLTSIFKSGTSKEEFWALKDVSFNVMPGDSLGIIGRNGAGKSTLLKILSRITPPTSGRIITRGRIASLLEVGTGFHQELSGRENIFMNGSILGMKREEIKNKFDEIVEFSGVEKFLDTQLKHYSSGMQLRLAFAVAANLEPEILIIDEVLAVGDAEFQKKCMGKMQEVSDKEGRTIIFVSHNMESLRQLCERGLLLNSGVLEVDSDIETVTGAYVAHQNYQSSNSPLSRKAEIKIENVLIYNESSVLLNSLNTFQHLRIECAFESIVDKDDVTFAIFFNNIYEKRVTTLWSSFNDKKFKIRKGKFKIIFNISSLHLIPGEYNLGTYVESRGIEIERIDTFRKIIVSYGERDFLHIPTNVQGEYIENFTTQIKEDVEEYYL
jgi:ABC-type polysaccharide/polyol phosphate transport system ATPase subunit